MRIFAVVTIAVLTALTALPASAGSFTNGDCELGAWSAATTAKLTTNLPGWTYWLNAGTIGNWYIGKNTWSKHGGTGAGGVYIQNAPNKIATITQTVDSGLTPGGTYRITAWLRANTIPASSVKLGAKSGADATYTWSASETSNTWTQYSVDASASAAGVLNIQVYVMMGTLSNTGGTSTFNGAFDDMTMELIAVPEPGGIIAVLTGLVGLSGLAIRRRR